MRHSDPNGQAGARKCVKSEAVDSETSTEWAPAYWQRQEGVHHEGSHPL